MTMSFRLVVRHSADADIRESMECQTSGEAFALCRRLTRYALQAVEVLDLRTGSALPISSAELEAIAQSERHGRFRTALRAAVNEEPLSASIS